MFPTGFLPEGIVAMPRGLATPDERMKKILTEAAAVGDASAHAIAHRTCQREAYYYEHSGWERLFVGGYKFELAPGLLNLDGYAQFFFYATGVTPAMEEKMVGRGSQYAWTATDSNNAALDGGESYKLHLPPHYSSKRFLVCPLLQR